MKKQFIAKLLVLVMVLAMIPAAMLTANATGTANTNYPYPSKGIQDTVPSAPKGNVYASTGSTAAASSSAATVKAADVKVEDGSAAIKATVTNGVANVSLPNDVVAMLEDAAEDDAITLEIDDEGATQLNIDFNAKAMAEVAKDTGADLVVKSSVATISIPNDILQSDAMQNGKVKVSAHTGVSVGFTIRVSGKSLKSITGVTVTF